MSSNDQHPIVDRLVEEFMDLQLKGESPSIDEYCARHPELADEIRDVFEALMMVEDLKPGSQDESGTFGNSVPVGQRLDHIGDYRILNEIGRGGMGVVYEAEQMSLGRRVAIKVLPRQAAGGGKALVRFQREAKAAARMHHTNIVPVFDVGTNSEHVFYAMQLIQGQALDLVIDDLKHIREEHSRRSKENETKKPPTSARSRTNAPESIALSLVSGNFVQARLGSVREGVSEAADHADYDVPTETINLKADSTSSATLPGQSDVSTAEDDRRAYHSSVAEIAQQVASALAYAHARGIVHRDIKPSNLLLDSTGVVWVTDFGLAKTGEEGLTHTGDILGTIRYMSPERFRGQCDVRADIYSLGLTLHELLTLKPAFYASDQGSLIGIINKSDPVSPRSIDPRVPLDLETIVLKAIDKDPKRRYQSADALKEDLQRFLNDQPITARRISLVERLTRWSRRNNALAASLAVVGTLLLVINIAGPLMYWRQAQLVDQLETNEQSLTTALNEAERAKNESERSKEEAQQSADVANQAKQLALKEQEQTRRNLYLAQMTMAQAARNAGDFKRQQELLAAWKTFDVATDLRSFEWYYLNSQISKAELIRTLRRRDQKFFSVAWSRDGKWIASGGPDSALRIWDAETGVLDRSIYGYWGEIRGIAWHPTETNLIATASAIDNQVRVIDLDTNEPIWIHRHSDWVCDVKWSPDGERLASCGKNSEIRIWDAGTGEPLEQLDDSTPRWYSSVAWHPDGNQLAASCLGNNQDVRIWNLETGHLELFSGHSSTVVDLDWHSDGRLASCTTHGEIFVWDPEYHGKTVFKGQHNTGKVESVKWSPTDENLLLSAAADGSVRIWNIETGQVVDTVDGHFDCVREVSWSPDGRQFVSASEDRTLKISRRVGSKQQKAEYSGELLGSDWSPTANVIAVGSRDGSIQFFNDKGKRELAGLIDSNSPTQSGAVRGVQFDPSGRWLASGGHDGHLRIWDMKSRKLWARSEEVHGSGVNDAGRTFSGIEALTWHPQKNLLVTLGWDRTLRAWDSTTAEVAERLPVEGGRCVCFSPNGELLVTGNELLQIWDTRSWTIIGTLDTDGFAVSSVQFSPDGTQLAACASLTSDRGGVNQLNSGWIRIWEVEGNKCDRWLMAEIARRTDRFRNLSWTPDGKRVATTSFDGITQVWDVTSPRTGRVERELLRFPSQSGGPMPLTFSPDGTKIAVGNGNSLVFHDASFGYRNAKSPTLLPGLETRIHAGKATPADFLLRAEIHAAEGDWVKAKQAAAEYLAFDQDAPWVLTDPWIAGQFRGDLSTTHDLEQLVHLENFSPADALDENRQPLWRRVQMHPSDPVDFRQLKHIAERDEPSFAYAFQRIYSPKTQFVTVLLGNDQFQQFWVNGELLNEDSKAGSFAFEEFVIPVELKPGWNSLLVKVANATGGGHSLLYRLSRDRDELIAAYERTRQFDQIVKLWDREVQSYPDDKSLLLKRAQARWRADDRGTADRDFDLFLTGRAQQASALKERAEAYFSLDRDDQALADLAQAVLLEPNDISLRADYARDCSTHGRLEEACTHLEQLIDLEPNEFLHRVHLATVLLAAGNVSEYDLCRSQLLATWQNESDPMIAERIAVLCLLNPLSGEELEIALKLAETAVASNRASRLDSRFTQAHLMYRPNFLMALGLAKYRQGIQATAQQDESTAHTYWTQAHQALETAIEGFHAVSKLENAAQARYVLALVLHHLESDRSEQLINENEIFYQDYQAAIWNWTKFYAMRTLRSEAILTVVGPEFELIDRVEQLLAAGNEQTAIEQIREIALRRPDSSFILNRLSSLIEKHRLGREVLTDTAENEGVSWQYRFDEPEAGWITTTGGTGWSTGPAPFGSKKKRNTDLQVEQRQCWFRRVFQLSEIPTNPIKLRIQVDGGARVTLNGFELVDLTQWNRFNDAYVEIDCTEEAASALRQGTNVLAVHFENTREHLLFDAGLHVVKQDFWSQILDELIEQHPQNLQLVEMRAKRHIRDERYLEAAHDFVRITPIRQDAPHVHVMNTACMFALSGDIEAYRSYCQRQLERNRNLETESTEDQARYAHFAQGVVESSLLLPGVISNELLPIASVRNRLDSFEASSPFRKDYKHTLALAAIRHGKFRQAAADISALEKTPGAWNESGTSSVHALRAHQLLGSAEAMQQIDRINEALKISKQDIANLGIRHHPDGSLIGVSLLDDDCGLKRHAIIGDIICCQAEQWMEGVLDRSRTGSQN